MARRGYGCRDCMRCAGVIGGGQQLDWILVLYTAGLWLLWIMIRPRCPRCAHVRSAHTRSRRRWQWYDYFRTSDYRRKLRSQATR
jgi:hypothetical protein